MYSFIRSISVALGLGMLVSLPAMSTASAEDAAAIHSKIETLLGSADDFDTIFGAIKTAFNSQNRDDVLEMADTVEYPLKVSGGDGQLTIKDSGEFTDKIDEILPDNVREVLANQRYEDLAVSSEGVMFGNGELWMNAICQDNACSSSYWAITAINR